MSGPVRPLDISTSSVAGPSRLSSVPPSSAQSAGPSTGRDGDLPNGMKEEEMGEELRTVDTSPWRDDVAGMLRARKRKWAVMGYDSSHMADLESTFLGYQMALTEDQLAVTHPPPRPSAFSSVEDAVERLLPYHVFQIHDCELEGQALEPRKAEERDKLEIAEATKLNDRINKVNERFFELRRREGTHPSHLPSLIQLLRSSTHQVRQELVEVQNKYRQAQNTLSELQNERLARERKEAAAQAANAAFAAKVRAQQVQKAQPTSTASPPVARPAGTPVRPPVPVKTATPTSTPVATKSTPSTPVTAPRPRGRPPKAKENGGLRETVLRGPGTPSTPQPASNGNATNPSAAPSTPSSSSPGITRATDSAQDPAKGPVTINIPTTLVPFFTTLGIISVQPDPAKPTPGKVVRTTPNKKTATISIELFKCTQPQLNGLAKVLGIKAGQGTSTGASGSAASAASSANASK